MTARIVNLEAEPAADRVLIQGALRTHLDLCADREVRLEHKGVTRQDPGTQGGSAQGPRHDLLQDWRRHSNLLFQAGLNLVSLLKG